MYQTKPIINMHLKGKFNKNGQYLKIKPQLRSSKLFNSKPILDSLNDLVCTWDI